jgi:A/G-specific adenine glycosylase
VQAALLDWYAAHGRDLPWRRTRDPYAILVSELMLQQTGVDRVIPKWRAWLARFPTLAALAAAPRAEVIRAWQGLGYNRRAVRLHEIARQAVKRYGGRLPSEVDELRTLGGIGAYTAGAVASFAFDRQVPTVDTNTRRVLGRVFLGCPALPAGDRRAAELARLCLPPGRAYEWNQALMDLGATICTQARPACLVCPLLGLCAAAPLMGTWSASRNRSRSGQRAVAEARAPYATSQRFYRGRVVDALRGLGDGEGLSLAELGPRVKPDYAPSDRAWLEGLARQLAAEGLAELTTDAGGGLRVRLPD